MAGKTINNFMFLKFRDAYWDLHSESQAAFLPALAHELNETLAHAYFYQLAPMSAAADLLIWNVASLENETGEAKFFESLARIFFSRRAFLQPSANLWGYTRPSVYAKAPSEQEINPFSEERAQYLVLYPFVKTIQWYLLGKDTRQGMMNEHIRIGHQYPSIKQLLLYSFGVQDQEFIVVYETANLYQFSELVNELRTSDVREYTERDTPVYAGIHRSTEQMAELFRTHREL
jgi:chlorite dismutase